MREDGRGLFVRGLVTDESPAGKAALKLIGDGTMNGLSIGFMARDWSPRRGRGRDLREIELREVSLVVSPMLPGARFAPVGHMLPGARFMASGSVSAVQTPGFVRAA
jgi:HK97 family phage prohead protease